MFGAYINAIAELRLAELIAAPSQVTDLGMGQPPDEAARSCLLATSLARQMDEIYEHWDGKGYPRKLSVTT